jgi:hypothetical protein
MAARATARDLLTRETVDRAALEKFRTDMLATHDAVSKRLVQAVADAREVLTPEQRHARCRGGWPMRRSTFSSLWTATSNINQNLPVSRMQSLLFTLRAMMSRCFGR